MKPSSTSAPGVADISAYDEPAWSVTRIAHGALWWVWFACIAGPHDISLWNLLRYYHRPFASHTKGTY